MIHSPVRRCRRLNETQLGSHQDDVRANAIGLKLHLRVVSAGRATFRVVTLRPATQARFSTNWFHQTWHMLTDRAGAFVLARLLWALSFQRERGTVVMLDRAHLVPTPFEADPPQPILLVPSWLTRADGESLRALRFQLRKPWPSKTVRFQTFGIAGDQPIDARHRNDPRRRRDEAAEHVDERAGFICWTAPAPIFRQRARAVYSMRHCREMDYEYLAYGESRAEGEVQVFREFATMLSAARVARRTVLGDPTRTIDGSADRVAIYEEAERATLRLRAARAAQRAHIRR